METSHQGIISPRPSGSAWILALASFVALLAMAFSILAAGVMWREAALHQKLDGQLALRDYTGGEFTLQELTAAPRLFAPVRMLADSEHLDRQRSSRQTARVLLSVLSAVGMSRLEEAQNRLSSVPPGQQEATIQKVQAALDELKAISQTLTAQRRRVQEAEAALAANGTQAHLISKDFADLFGLRPLMQEVDEEPPPPYRAGVLEGLPRIKGLRDNIVDLTFLKVELDGLKATVKVEGPDPAKAFSERVASLREAYAGVAQTRNELDSLLATLDEDVGRLAKELQSKRADIESRLKAEVSELVRQETFSAVIKSLLF